MAKRLAQYLFPKRSSATTPAAGYVELYSKTDGRFYSKNEAGTESPLSNVYVQNTDPGLVSQGIWIQTGLGGGSDFTIWFEDGV